MRLTTTFLTASLVLLCAVAADSVRGVRNGGEAPESQTSWELLQQTQQLTDIRSANGTPFRMTARIEVYDERGKKKEGTYTLLWNSPTIWRDEISFPDYVQIRVARTNKLLISRHPPTVSRDVFRLGKLLDFPSLLCVGMREQENKYKNSETKLRTDQVRG
jgi:hypothetical protein